MPCVPVPEDFQAAGPEDPQETGGPEQSGPSLTPAVTLPPKRPPPPRPRGPGSSAGEAASKASCE